MRTLDIGNDRDIAVIAQAYRRHARRHNALCGYGGFTHPLCAQAGGTASAIVAAAGGPTLALFAAMRSNVYAAQRYGKNIGKRAF